MLTEAQWAKMKPHCLGKPADRRCIGGDDRRFIEAVLWVVPAGPLCSNQPAFFGTWNSVFKGAILATASRQTTCTRKN